MVICCVPPAFVGCFVSRCSVAYKKLPVFEQNAFSISWCVYTVLRCWTCCVSVPALFLSLSETVVSPQDARVRVTPAPPAQATPP
jgi:hypothetical protein